MHLNVEIKAKLDSLYRIRNVLKDKNAPHKGIDHQIDTYFNVPCGRMKLREGNIENCLIFYEREAKGCPKESKVILFDNQPGSALKEMLVKSLGMLAVVEKVRGIYFVDNIKFHIDFVYGLGTFVEIEAIDKNGSIGKEKLYKQCRKYMDLFGIRGEDLIEKSYSDLLLEKMETSV